MTILETVSQYICNRRTEEEEARRIGLDCLRDTLGCMLLGCQEGDAGKVIHYVKACHSPGQALVYGRKPFRADAASAAFANGVSAHCCDFDDMTGAGCGHPSIPVLPVVLALGEVYHKPGREILDSYMTGMEVSMRLAKGVLGGSFPASAWNPTTVMGIFGATAAAAQLLKLDRQQTCAALGMATCEAGGTRGNYGTSGKNIAVGHLCMKGIRCAWLAREGIQAAADSFESRNGFIHCYVKGYDVEAGKQAFTEKNSFLITPGIIQKPYPTCRSNHNGIDGAVWLHGQADCSSDRIQRVECLVDPASFRLDGCQIPHSPEEAKFSTAYCVALGLLYGKVEARQFLESGVLDEGARALAARIQVTESRDFLLDASFPCRVRVYFTDGSCKEYLGEYASGDPRKPLSAGERQEKFRTCVAGALGEAAAGELYQRLEGLEDCPDLNRITEWIYGKQEAGPACEPSGLRK